MIGKALHLARVSKSFGGVQALKEVTLTFKPSCVHALLGANGAGKSTLGWLLAGRFRDYTGQISIGTERVCLRSRIDSLRCGIHLVSQESDLAPNLSVAESLFVGLAPHWRRKFFYSRRALIRDVRDTVLKFGLDLNPSQLVGTLPLFERRAIDIVRACLQQPRFLILDEPAFEERESSLPFLSRALHKLRSLGTGVILITHDISRALAITDEVTVVRDGNMAMTAATSSLDKGTLTNEMFSAHSSSIRPYHSLENTPAIPQKLRIIATFSKHHSPQTLDLVDRSVTALISTNLYSASRLIRSISGIDHGYRIIFSFNGLSYEIASPRAALAQGITYLTSDRKTEGVFPNLTVQNNITLFTLSSVSYFGIVKRSAQYSVATRIAQEVGIDTARLGDRAEILSGGNQQRMLLGRITHDPTKVRLLDEPARGIDVNSLPTIARYINAAALPGRWTVVSSIDGPFVSLLTDRIENVIWPGPDIGLSKDLPNCE